jgi:hypothetical protein
MFEGSNLGGFTMQNASIRLSYANVMSTIAVFLALGGGAMAAVKLKANQVKTKNIAPNAVTGDKALESSFSKVPTASQADNAAHAASADSAPSAANATNATNAANATNLANLGTIVWNGSSTADFPSGLAAHNCGGDAVAADNAVLGDYVVTSIAGQGSNPLPPRMLATAVVQTGQVTLRVCNVSTMDATTAFNIDWSFAVLHNG